MAEYSGNDLLIGHNHRNRSVTIASGADLTRGAVLGIVTASGKYVLSASAASDGSETPVAILAVDAAAAGADVVAPVYYSGEFNAEFCTFGTGHTVTTVDAAFAAAQAPMHVRTVS
jgi:hypothetical protein